MRRFLIHRLLWFIVAFVVLFICTIFRISISDPSPTDLSIPQKEATSLVPVGDTRPDTSPSTQPIKKHDAVLVALLDGTLVLMERKTRRILVSFQSGHPIYSSYQAPLNLDAHHHEDRFSSMDSTYIDCGDDWGLYEFDRIKGIKKKYKFNAQGFLNLTPIVSENGLMITGQMTTTTIAIDAKTGRVIWAISSSGTPALGSASVQNPVVLEEVDNKLPYIVNHQQLTITRKDYTFTGHSMLSGQVLWNLTFADIEADLSCPQLESSRLPHNLGARGGLDLTMASFCRNDIVVLRIRDGGHSAQTYFVDSVDRVPLPGDILPSLPPLEDVNALVAIGDYQSEYDSGRPNPEEELLALPAAVVDYLDGSSIHDKTSGAHNFWLPVLSGLVLSILVVGFAVFHYITTARASKEPEDPKHKVVAAKKKRTKKPGVIKDNAAKAIQLHGSEDVCSLPETIATKSRSTSDSQDYAFTDGRRIGKLMVSSNEIAKGSNGTIVLEGIYDGRPVAVKRMVKTHHDLAIKEIQNLIASDQHPNIVRWYGVEFDEDFVYLSLERCTCSLYDLICLGNAHATTATESIDIDFMNEYIMQLQQKTYIVKDLSLWKANGYPSPQLLKLLRDVVGGLAHLHELGIIHRDLKPQNVLIIKERIICAKLSDMGISKRLDEDLSSISHHATGIGSSGWRAPEQLLHGRQSRAVDLFSLGCLLFFCMTGGKHPFGDRFERDANIVKNQKDLFLVEHIPEAVDIITQLLDPNPELRPKAGEVMQHPLFWSSDTRLSFLRDASDRVELEDRESETELLKALEGATSSALGGKWDEKLENTFINNIGKYRRYKYDSVRDLLRVIRNKLNHYRELPKEIQELLGPVPEGFDSYFTRRFPRLLIEVYCVIQKYCREEELLSKYFKSSLM